MTPRTLAREPWRGSMICGWQIHYAGPYCAERKADGLAMCEFHYFEIFAEYGEVHMANGNVVGDPEVAVRLLWEPLDGTDPVEPTAEEMALYAPILDLPYNA